MATLTMTLPTIPLADIKTHNTKESCYVTIGKKVYDITDFVEDHPGGPDFILDYAGTDIFAILKDEKSHTHSETAYEILEDSLVGYIATDPVLEAATKSNRPNGIVPLPPTANGAKEIRAQEAGTVYEATGMSSADDLSKDTDLEVDYKRHKFLDLNKPLLMQVLRGGFTKKFYLEQVHRPRHYKGGASAPLFGNFLEPLSKTAWYVIPILWLPVITAVVIYAGLGLGSVLKSFTYFGSGLFLWTLIEYGLHRFLFHLDHYLPDNSVFLTLHFLIHGIHHYLPMDKYRLVMPPTLLVLLATPFWHFAHFVIFWNWYGATTTFAGGLLGYVLYDMTHYFLHHRNLPAFWQETKKYHLAHHFADYENGFGVTSRFWDDIFGTQLAPLQPPKVLKTL